MTLQLTRGPPAAPPSPPRVLWPPGAHPARTSGICVPCAADRRRLCVRGGAGGHVWLTAGPPAWRNAVNPPPAPRRHFQPLAGPTLPSSSQLDPAFLPGVPPPPPASPAPRAPERFQLFPLPPQPPPASPQPPDHPKKLWGAGEHPTALLGRSGRHLKPRFLMLGGHRKPFKCSPWMPSVPPRFPAAACCFPDVIFQGGKGRDSCEMGGCCYSTHGFSCAFSCTPGHQ